MSFFQDPRKITIVIAIVVVVFFVYQQKMLQSQVNSLKDYLIGLASGHRQELPASLAAPSTPSGSSGKRELPPQQGPSTAGPAVAQSGGQQDSGDEEDSLMDTSVESRYK